MLVVDALIKANKDFDLLMLPNRRHGFGGEPYMMRRRWDYFVKHLMGAEPPKEYEIRKPTRAAVPAVATSRRARRRPRAFCGRAPLRGMHANVEETDWRTFRTAVPIPRFSVPAELSFAGVTGGTEYGGRRGRCTTGFPSFAALRMTATCRCLGTALSLQSPCPALGSVPPAEASEPRDRNRGIVGTASRETAGHFTRASARRMRRSIYHRAHREHREDLLRVLCVLCGSMTS